MNKRNHCLLLSIMLAAALTMAGWCVPVFADTGLNVDEHSKQDIIDYIDKADIAFFEDDIYVTKPVTDTVRGELSDTTKNHTLALLNTFRYIAGLDPVVLNDEYGAYAQAAAFVNMSLFQLTHYPADVAQKPADMSQEDWDAGAYGAGKCNLAAGYTLASAPQAWIMDEDAYNISRVGHRRWSLNPKMGKTGFGAADPFTAMYSLDKSGSGTQSNVSWPAANMPIEYFPTYAPWSLSTGTGIDKASVKVKLTRERDGKVWNFDGSTEYSENDALYFNVDNSYIGDSSAIIFRPDGIDAFYEGDKFNVEITGAGEDVISYTVTFFELTHDYESFPRVEPTTTSEGNIAYTHCATCGKYFDAETGEEITLEKTVIPKLPPETKPADGGKTDSDVTDNPAGGTPGDGGNTNPGSKADNTSSDDSTSGDGASKTPDNSTDSTSAGTAETTSANVGDTVPVTQGSVKVTSTANMTVAFTKAQNKKSVVVPDTVSINGDTYKVTQINAGAFTGSSIRTVTVGKNVKSIKKNAFKGSKASKLIVKTKLLKKASVKGCLKGSKVKTVQVKVGSKSENRKYVKNYKKCFAKKNAGRKVSVK